MKKLAIVILLLMLAPNANAQQLGSLGDEHFAYVSGTSDSELTSKLWFVCENSDEQLSLTYNEPVVEGPAEVSIMVADSEFEFTLENRGRSKLVFSEIQKQEVLSYMAQGLQVRTSFGEFVYETQNLIAAINRTRESCGTQ